MELVKKNFPKTMKDNDEIFLSQLEGVINSVDELCSVEITKLSFSYKVRIAPSAPIYTNNIIEELIQFHNLFGLRMDMSKSIVSTAVITYIIKLE